MAKHEDPQVVLLSTLSTPQEVRNSDGKLATGNSTCGSAAGIHYVLDFVSQTPPSPHTHTHTVEECLFGMCLHCETRNLTNTITF